MEEWRELGRSAGKAKKCLEKLARNMPLKRQVKQSLSDTVGVRRWAARKRSLLLPG